MRRTVSLKLVPPETLSPLTPGLLTTDHFFIVFRTVGVFCPGITWQGEWISLARQVESGESLLLVGAADG